MKSTSACITFKISELKTPIVWHITKKHYKFEQANITYYKNLKLCFVMEYTFTVFCHQGHFVLLEI